jgi:hypothetical protein
LSYHELYVPNITAPVPVLRQNPYKPEMGVVELKKTESTENFKCRTLISTFFVEASVMSFWNMARKTGDLDITVESHKQSQNDIPVLIPVTHQESWQTDVIRCRYLSKVSDTLMKILKKAWKKNTGNKEKVYREKSML